MAGIFGVVLPVLAAPVAGTLPVLPLSFEENVGQGQAGVRYLAQGGRHRVGLTSDSALVGGLPGNRQLRLRFPGPGTLRAEGAEARVSHYLHGADRSQWLRNVRHYGQVRLGSTAHGIDVVFHGRSGELEYDFEIAAGADPRQARIVVEGADSITLAEDGSLQIRVGDFVMRQRSPVAAQGGQPVSVRFALSTDGKVVSFALGQYDRGRALVIDPVIEFSTYVGGKSPDAVNAIALLQDGSLLMAGSIGAEYFGAPLNPLPGQSGPPAGRGGSEIFLARLNATGTQILSSVYLGGNGYDGATAMAVDSAGNVLLSGNTSSANFPGAASGFKPTITNANIFADQSGGFFARLNPALNDVLYSTFLPSAASISLDSGGGAVLAGTTRFNDVPVTNGSLQRTLKGLSDIFLIRVTPSGSLSAATYYGSQSGTENPVRVVIEPSGSILLIGTSDEYDVPAPTGFTAPPAGRNLFVARLSSSLSAITSLQFVPGRVDNYATYARFTSTGALAVFFPTSDATLTTTTNAFQRTFGGLSPSGIPGNDLFFRRIASDLQTLEYATYLGGGSSESPTGMAIDSAGDIYLLGGTNSDNFPVTANALFAANRDDYRVNGVTVLVRIAPDNSIRLSTLIAGRGLSANSILVPSPGVVFLSGFTEPMQLPVTPNAFQSVGGGSYADGFVMKLDLDSSCAFTVDPILINVPSGGGTFTINVGAPVNCTWATNAASEWVQVNRPNATQATVTVGQGGVSGRASSVYIAGRTIPVLQPAAPCVFSLSPSTVSVGAFGGSVSYNMTGPQGCQWFYERSDPWLTGNPTDIYANLKARVNYSSGARTGTAVIGGRTLTVNQAANTCTYSVSPTVLRFEELTQNATLVRVVASRQDCFWDSVIPADSWVQNFPNGTGTGDVVVFGSRNSGPTRTEVIMIAGQAITITQVGGGGNTTPIAGITSPRSTSGSRQLFEWTFSDNDGMSDIGIANVLINSALDGRQACYVAFDRPNNMLFLVPDSGDGLVPGTLGAATSIANRQCTIQLATSSVTTTPYSMTLRLDISFSTEFSGNKIIYTAVRDRALLNSGWMAAGTFGVRTPAATDPLPLSVTVERVPNLLSYEATIVYRHAGGASNIRATQLLINASLDALLGCYIGFDHAANVAYLFNDDGRGLIPQGVVPGAFSNTVSNSQCELSGVGTSRVINGDLMTLKFRLNFFTNFRRRFFTAFAGVQGTANSGWHALLSLTVP